MNKRACVCTDRILPKDLMRFQPTTHGMDVGGAFVDMRTRAIAPIGKSWMNGSVLRVRFMGGTPKERAIVIEQSKWISDACNLKFDFNDAPGAEIRITFDQNDGAWSYVGTDCQGIPLNQPTMNLGFTSGGTTAHELLHAAGMAHEHQNPAAGIQWNEELVLREAAKSPNFWDAATTRHNVLRKYSADQINGTAFDRDSIMLYWFPPEWTLNGIGTKANEVLSVTDKTFLASAVMYPKDKPTPSDATELFVNANRTVAAIGQIGEQDLYKFTVSTDGQYVILTDGKTDTILNLYGPNSETALIATDDDSGSMLSSRIERSLIAGEYYASVRHYNAKKGVGNYTIGVATRA